MARSTWTLALMAAASLGLAACDGGGDNGGGGGGGGTAQDNFGAAFAALFNADATDAPADPAAGDVPAVSLTADPTAI